MCILLVSINVFRKTMLLDLNLPGLVSSGVFKDGHHELDLQIYQLLRHLDEPVLSSRPMFLRSSYSPNL